MEEIVRRLTHRDSAVQRRSIGVVTFNSEQQSLIEDMLDDARRRYPEIEQAFSGERDEPVFVKNLETVQGDERDVILFSVTYGPDRSGHVTMNFGPLNREGGERRLNVAVTRARSEMIVFSALHPDRIDLSRTQARAVADLKHFLEYAEKGKGVLGSAVQGYTNDFESPFEAAVARELRMKDWQVHPQVGVSAYRIDLGIVHPDAPGRYLAGIECDGAMYHSSAFARERDKIRQSVLEDLGWTILRIWSTDWWTNKEGALKKVDDVLSRHLEDARREQAEQEQAGFPDQQVGDEPDTDDGGMPEKVQGDVAGTRSLDAEMASWITQNEEPEPSDMMDKTGHLEPYHGFEGQSGPDPRSAIPARVAEGLCLIIQCEGPMLAKRAYDVYLRGCGVHRMGGELKRRMNRALQYAIRQGLVLTEDEGGGGELVDSIVRSPDAPPVAGRERGPRSFDEIPPSELQLVARQLLMDRNGEFECGSELHLRAVLGMFDLSRLTTPVGVKLLDILERRYPYVDEALGGSETS